MLSSVILFTTAKAAMPPLTSGHFFFGHNGHTDREQEEEWNRLYNQEDRARTIERTNAEAAAARQTELQELRQRQRDINRARRQYMILPTVETAIQWNAEYSNYNFIQTEGLCLGFTVDDVDRPRTHQYCLKLNPLEVVDKSKGKGLILVEFELPGDRQYHHLDVYHKIDHEVKGIDSEPRLQDGSWTAQVAIRYSNETKWKTLKFENKSQAEQFITNVKESVKILFYGDARIGQKWTKELPEHVNWQERWFQKGIYDSQSSELGADGIAAYKKQKLKRKIIDPNVIQAY